MTGVEYLVQESVYKIAYTVLIQRNASKQKLLITDRSFLFRLEQN